MSNQLILTVALAVFSVTLIEVHGEVSTSFLVWKDFQTRFFLRPPIISGQDAYPGQFPWQVILKKDINDELLCGGSIISNNWVLTAAHCTAGRSSVVVSFGTVNRDDLSNYQVVGASGIFVNPDYVASVLKNDVSLIKLPTPLTFNRLVQPIRLSTSSVDSYPGQLTTIVGFGVMDDDNLDYSEYLKYASMIIRDQSVCLNIYPGEYVTANTICAEPLSGNQNICSGDSGGPLIVRTNQGEYVQVGINSYVVEDECTASYPSGFVRITSYISYISSVTGLTF